MKSESLALIMIVLLVSGCSNAANPARAQRIQARDDMVQSRTAYRDCARANSSEPRKCAGLKEAFETDLQAYNALFNRNPATPVKLKWF